MSDEAYQVAVSFLNELSNQLSEGLEKISHCVKQLSDEQVWWRPTESQNSIANLILHLEGNVHQWVVSGVGGEPDVRDRPGEFSASKTMEKRELIAKVTETVQRSIEIVSSQTASTVLEERRIQGFDTTVAGAIIDSVTHFQGHSQEIISLTRQQLEERYSFYFVPQSPEQEA